MNKIQRAIVSFLVIVCMCLIAVTASGCSTTGGMVQFGYLPVTSIDHHEMLDQKGRK